jgi:tetratricopeptide (TPR) repeat protein
MRTIILILTLTLLSFQNLKAQDIDAVQQNFQELFDRANEEYRQQNYSAAQEIYQVIEDSAWVSAELYLNIGNTFYQQEQLAPSIYYFEKGLLLDPLNQDLAKNLEIANRNTIDQINALPQSVYQKIDRKFFKVLSVRQWAVFTVVVSFVFGLSFLFFHFSVTPTRRRVFFISSIISAAVLLFGLGISFKEYGEFQSNRPAIVFVQEVKVKNAPLENAEDDFLLHEGTKVQVLDQLDLWRKIKIIDGSQGWVTSKSIKELK